jgi:hypothetical protein
MEGLSLRGDVHARRPRLLLTLGPLVREPERWVAYFATDPQFSAASILEAVADRSALEQPHRDVTPQLPRSHRPRQ